MKTNFITVADIVTMSIMCTYTAVKHGWGEGLFFLIMFLVLFLMRYMGAGIDKHAEQITARITIDPVTGTETKVTIVNGNITSMTVKRGGCGYGILRKKRLK